MTMTKPILLSTGGSIVLFVAIITILGVLVYFVVKGAFKDLKDYNLEKYLIFNDVLPKRAFIKLLKNSIEKRSDINTSSIVYVSIDKIQSLENSLNEKIIRGILEEAVERIRTVYPNETVISAFNKGQFYLFLSDEHEYDEVMQFSYKLLEELSKPYSITKQTNINISASIAVAFYPVHGENVNEILKVLASVMRQINNSGGNAVRTLQADRDVTKSEYLDYYHEIKIAIEEEQFEFFYQPNVNTVDDKVNGVTLFLRWNHPELGLLAAAKFIKVLEQSGDIYWVAVHGLEMMCKQYETLTKIFENDELLVSLSLSGREFYNPNIVSDFQKILRKYKFDPKNLVLDIPVPILMKPEDDTITNSINRLKKLGFKISTDIYAVNLFDLEKIMNEKADVLTLGRSFLEEDRQATNTYLKIFADNKDSSNSILIAEQVESETEQSFYQQHNINIIQGNYIAPVMSIKETSNWMTKFKGEPMFKPIKQEDELEEEVVADEEIKETIEEKLDEAVEKEATQKDESLVKPAKPKKKAKATKEIVEDQETVIEEEAAQKEDSLVESTKSKKKAESTKKNNDKDLDKAKDL